MLELNYLIKGIGVGISVSAPLGPVGVLCIQRIMNKGFKSGVFSGIGAVFADTLYAIIAGFGLTMISDFLDDHQLYLRIIGGMLLIFLGIRIFISNPAKQFRKQQVKKTNHIADFFTVFFLTISNPVTIVVFGGVFAALGLVESSGDMSVILLTIGIFLGAVIWWLSLSGVVTYFRDKIRLRSLWWINKITGVVIMLLGLVTGLSIFFAGTLQI